MKARAAPRPRLYRSCVPAGSSVDPGAETRQNAGKHHSHDCHDADDENHNAAIEFADCIKRGEYRELVSSYVVLVALMSWFSRYPAKKVEIGEKLRGGFVRLEWVDRDVGAAAWKLFRKHLHHPFSLTDCTSFVLMNRLKIRDVFAFDDDFDRPGKYRRLPE